MSAKPTTKIDLSPEVREQFREAGRRGGNATVEKHGRELFQRIGRVGGKLSKRTAVKKGEEVSPPEN